MKATCTPSKRAALFGYRFVYPAMRVGRHEVYWHRPLVAWLRRAGRAGRAARRAARLSHGLSGRQAELGPRRSNCGRAASTASRTSAAVALFDHDHDRRTAPYDSQRPQAARHLGAARRRPLPRVFARQLLDVAEAPDAASEWLDGAARPGRRRRRGERLVEELRRCSSREARSPPQRRQAPVAGRRLTFDRTATRAVREAYWKTIADSGGGQYLQQEQRRLRARPATQQHADPPTTATWKRWATTCWIIT